MDLDSSTHSFVIRVWREENGPGRPPGWRGHITHVPSNARRSVESLEQITAFIARYLRDLGVEPLTRRAAGRRRWWRGRG
jgi:hypothetical protein